MLSRPKTSTRENAVQSHLIKTAKALGGKAAKVTGEAGTPDTLVTVPAWSRPILVECKRPGEWPEPHQVERAAEWIAGGMLCFWVSTQREVEALLREGRPSRTWHEAAEKNGQEWKTGWTLGISHAL